MLGANLYMYFHYQTMGVYEHTIPPTLLHYAGMLVLYSVTCAFAMKHLPIRYFATWLFLMVAVRNVVAPAIGTSVYANWLQERQQHYITHFAQDVRLDNPQSSAPFVQAAYLGQRQGKDSFEASRWASTLIKAGFLASHFGSDERHHRLYHLDLHGQRIISPMCTLL